MTSVMAAEWRDPDDTTPGAARTARTVRAYRSFDPLRRRAARAPYRITEQHLVAADLLRGWADGAAIGFTARRDLSMPVGGVPFRPSLGPGATSQRQTRCWRNFTRAMAIFNSDQRSLVTHVVLLNQSVRSWCLARLEQGLPLHRDRTVDDLVACLDQLVTFLDTEVHEAIGRGMAA